MAAFLAGIPVWLWLVWVVSVFLAAMVLAPRRWRSDRLAARRTMRIGAQVLLGAALVTVRAETAQLATLLAALGGAIYSNALPGDDDAPPQKDDSDSGS